MASHHCIKTHKLIHHDCGSMIRCVYRQFMDELLPGFRSENPQLNVIESLRPGHHPYLKAEYSKLLPTICQILSMSLSPMLQNLLSCPFHCQWYGEQPPVNDGCDLSVEALFDLQVSLVL